jgi:hypothetical protein
MKEGIDNKIDILKSNLERSCLFLRIGALALLIMFESSRAYVQ